MSNINLRINNYPISDIKLDNDTLIITIDIPEIYKYKFFKLYK